VKYLPPFELVLRSVNVSSVRGERHVSLVYGDFMHLVKSLLAAIEVDEAWYLRTYEDIVEAIRNGAIQSARRHFMEDGYFEGRLSFPIAVNEAWHTQRYPDVGDSIRKGLTPSAQVHFNEDGYREGRLPFGL
jgi:hypothetical protein